jgi:hypothetical protein
MLLLHSQTLKELAAFMDVEYLRELFQNQFPIGWWKKYKMEKKTLLYGIVTYITELLLHKVGTHI